MRSTYIAAEGYVTAVKVVRFKLDRFNSSIGLSELDTLRSLLVRGKESSSFVFPMGREMKFPNNFPL